MSQKGARSKEDGNVKLRASSLPFLSIPHQSKLFLEYLRDPCSLNRFYPNAQASYADVSSFVPEVLANYKTDRNALCNALAEINSAIGAGEKTYENINLLREAETVAVVTGQQAGLFTGPLYTIYKALSAVRMAEFLNANGTKAVPVFWAATEDHDFDEVSGVSYLDSASELATSAYRPANYLPQSSVGNVEIDDSIVTLIGAMFDALPKTEFTYETRVAAENAWAPGATFGRAFTNNLAHLLARFGIVFVDPLHDGIKSLAAPIYISAIEKSADLVDDLQNKSRQLVEEGFHAQVLVEDDYFPLFYHDDEGRRLSLRKVETDKYRAKGEKTEFTISDLATIAKNYPQRFSPGVMVRPIVQDYLFPTVCYFGGAAEIAYFAQNSGAYLILERPVTPILHRQSFTLLEAKHRRTLDKYDLDLTDLFTGYETVLETMGQKELSEATALILNEIEQNIEKSLNRLDSNLSAIDPTLTESLAKRRGKIMHHIKALQKGARLASVRKDATGERQIKSAFSALLPNGQLQERVINVYSFLNKYGEFLIDLIYDAVDLDNKGHRIIDL